MMLKKQMKEQISSGKSTMLNDSLSKEEMNELRESSEEMNAGDKESVGTITGEGDHLVWSDSNSFFDDERSLAESDDERERFRARKAKDAKVNNSFTGPYPLDPTDFNHTDKGTNAQFIDL